MINKFVFFLCLVILIGVEIGRVYFIMPFPGSQRSNTIEIAYFLHNYINYFRILFFLLMAYSAWRLFPRSEKIFRWSAAVLLLVWLMSAFAFTFKLQADKMFYQPKTKSVVNIKDNKVPTHQLIIGVVRNGESKAYPIEIIGYHHQVRDTVGGTPIMVTYCTVCRTGRIFSPLVNGKPSTFRLVGMDHFNAMFEDKETKSWWRQVSGEAIIGPMKGHELIEIPSEQMTLQAWISRHPDTKCSSPTVLS